MRTRLAAAVSCSAVLALACAPAGDKTDQTAGGTTATPSGAPTTITAADLAGTWNMAAVPASGSDTTSTVFTMIATADTTGWQIVLPNRAPMPTTVRVGGDSIITSGPSFESVRRPGVQVNTVAMSRLQDGKLVGTLIARYTTSGPDSILVMRLTGTRAPK